MTGALPNQPNCCSTCEDPTIQNIPGVTGDAGAAGSDGSDGVNAYTSTTQQFIMPDGTGGTPTVSVSVGTTAWMVETQMLYVENAGYMKVSSITDTTTVVLLNPEDGSGAYSENVAPTTPITTGSKVSPAGIQGISTGAAGTAGGDLEGTYPNPTIGISTAVGDILVANNTSAPRWTKLARGTDKYVLHSDDGATPKISYRQIDLSGANTSITGATPIANGGTGQTAKTSAFDALSPTTTKGDLTVNDGTDNVRQAVGSNGTVLMADSTQTNGIKYAFVGSSNLGTSLYETTVDSIILEYRTASGVNGTTGGGTPSAWQARVISTITQDTTGSVALSSHANGGVTGNAFFLPAGYYRIWVSANGNKVGNHQIRLYGVDAAAVAVQYGTVNGVYGTPAYSTVTSGFQTASVLQARIYASDFGGSGGEKFAVHHFMQTNSVVAAHGADISSGGDNVFMTIKLEKLARP